ncbi:MAG: hypothetical protein P9M05_02255 [Candidatus Stygibacter australis]|nr:hypothetical protein [Candidatus Stygibacter australis]
MKIIIKLMLITVLLITLISCNLGIGDGEPDKDLGDRILLLNADGTEDHFFGRYCQGESGTGYDAYYGIIQFFNDNRHFLLSNRKLMIFDAEIYELDFVLEDIDLDFNSTGMTGNLSERACINYDDSLMAFTSGQCLYYLEMETKEYFQITDSGRDYYPAFSLDNKVFFCRMDSTGSSCKLMSIYPDGTGLEEHCSFDEKLSRILPGQVDRNMVFIVKGNSYFYQYDRETDQLDYLCEIPNDCGKVVDRSNDDNFFSFNQTQTYLYVIDDETLYSFPEIDNKNNAKIMPDGESIVVHYFYSNQELLYFDFKSNTFTYQIQLEHGSLPAITNIIDISSDGQRIAVITRILND